MTEEKPEGFSVDTPEEASQEEPEKKRYYTPGEVRKRKGCVGCGSMVVGVLGLIPIVLAAGAFL